jgi:hypothetical protein
MSSAAALKAHESKRCHPEAKAGDRFGDRTVVATMPRGHRGRSDERVRWRCKCGTIGESYVFNLRGAANACRHEPRGKGARFTIAFHDACTCGHSRADHRPKGGPCLDDDCDCFAFETEADR